MPELIVSMVGAIKENPVYLVMLVPIGFLVMFVTISINDAVRKARYAKAQQAKKQ